MNLVRVELLRRSLRAHTCAWIGLVPILGLPFAMAAWINAILCLRLQKQFHNPARRKVWVALVLSIAGTLASLMIVLALVLRIIREFD